MLELNYLPYVYILSYEILLASNCFWG